LDDYLQAHEDPVARQVTSTALAAELAALTNWWMARMVATTNPLQEKLTLLLHGHFPTAISKVILPLYMYRQNQLFRTQGSGDFTALTQSVATDPAMLLWLDAVSDVAADPNENFARELMERFTMGIGAYTENDVLSAAACFTGWQWNAATGAFVIAPKLHNNVPQTFLHNPQVNSGQQVIDIVTRSKASTKFVPARFWSHLAYPVAISDPVVSDLTHGYARERNIAALLRAIFEHPAFLSSTSATGLVKQPIEYVVGALRALNFAPADVSKLKLQSTLAGLGQVPFNPPPDVGGWSQNEYWLSSAAALARWQFAYRLTATADLSAVADEPPKTRVEATAALLSLPGWNNPTTAILQRASGNPRTLVTLALVSPEYQMN
jgi:uncharacterized protein (DUF1800 family)